MKKIFALILATVMVAGVAAPTYAATASCTYADNAICATESLSPTTGD